MNGGHFRFACALLLFPCIQSFGGESRHGELFAIAASTSTAAIELHLSRLDVLGEASRPWFQKAFLDNTTFRGDVAEVWAARTAISEYLGRSGGNWVSLDSHAATKTGAARAQGLDHVFLKLRKDGIPEDIFIGETKWRTSQLAKGRGPGKDIDQMSRDWTLPRLKTIAEEYFEFAKAETIRFAKKIPSGRAVRDIYLQSNKQIHFWKGTDGLWYCDGNPGDVKAIQTRATTFGRFLQGVAERTVRTRSGLFHLSPDGNDIVFTHQATRSTGKLTTVDGVDFTTRIPGEWIKKGMVPLDVIKQHLSKVHKEWNEQTIRSEAKKLQKDLSAQELIDTKQNLNAKAIREGVGSSVRGGAFAFALSAAFSSWGQYRTKGNRLSDWDWGQIGRNSGEMGILTASAVGVGQGIAYQLAGRQILGRTITTTVAKRVGGIATAAIFSAYAFRGYWKGDISLLDASVDASLTAASFGISAAILALAPETWWAGPVWVAALAAGAGVAYVGEWGYKEYKGYHLFFADSAEWNALIDQYLDDPSLLSNVVDKHLNDSRIREESK